jgi:hypothetical protein
MKKLIVDPRDYSRLTNVALVDCRDWDRLANVSKRTGISRPELFRAAVRGDVLASHLKKPGATKGVWLVNIASVDAYIRSFLPGGIRYQKNE